MLITSKAYDVSAFASKDLSRPNLNRVAVWPGHGVVCATNGHVLATASTVESTDEMTRLIKGVRPYLVDAKQWASMFRGWRKGDELAVETKWIVPRDCLTVGDAILPSDPVLRFPEPFSVWPVEQGDLPRRIHFTHKTLTPILTWLKRGGSGYDDPFSMTFDPSGSLGPVVLERECDGVFLRALVMPHRG